MARKYKVIRQAQFDEKLKIYIFLYGFFILGITCIGIPLMIPWALLGMAYVTRYFNTLSCTLTERELSIKKGIWFRQEKTIPLEKITDLAVHEGPIQRSFGLCSLKVETAGSSNPQGGSDAGLIGVVDPLEFRDAVLDQRDALSEPRDSGRPRVAEPREGDLPASGSTQELLTQIRDSLQRIEAALGDRSN